MKPYLKHTIFSLFLILACFIFNSCGDSPMFAPEDTWCRTRQNVSGVDLDIYFYYTESEDDITAGKVTLKKGLNVVVTENSTTANNYALYTFEKGKTYNEVEGTDDITDSPENPDNGFTVNGTTWDLIYIYFYKKSFKDNETKTHPSFLDKSNALDDISKISELASNLSWKDILKSVILAYL